MMNRVDQDVVSRSEVLSRADVRHRPRVLRRDPRRAIPLYVQLREALRTDIHDRGLQPGDRLPTEGDLEQRYGVSRSTIRQAVGDLEAEGLLRRIQGKGTFVATPRIQHVPILTSFSELLRSQGFAPSHRLLESALVAAPAEVAAGLGLGQDATCRYLERLFFADGDPVGVAQTWLPLDVIGAYDDVIEAGAREDQSLYELLEQGSPDLIPHHAVETINPGLASVAEATLLDCDPGTPLLLIQRHTRTPDDHPLEWTRLRFVRARYEYRVELRRPAQASS